MITVGFGSPYLIERFPQAETWLAAFGISDVAQISVARALFGEIPVRGKLPVTIPGVNLKAGFGMELPANPMKLQPMDARGEAQLKPAYDVIEKAVADKAFPGATLAVGNRGKVSVHAFGKLSYDAKAAATVPTTMYDIASLTKVVATTTLVAKLAEGDFAVPLDLDAKIERYLPEWAGGPNTEWRHRVTVRHLLTHTSLRTGDERSLFGLGNYFDGGNHRAVDGEEARRFGTRVHFFAAGDEGHDVPSAEKDLAGNCADGD